MVANALNEYSKAARLLAAGGPACFSRRVDHAIRNDLLLPLSGGTEGRDGCVTPTECISIDLTYAIMIPPQHDYPLSSASCCAAFDSASSN